MSYSGGGTMTPSQDSEGDPARYKDGEDAALAAEGISEPLHASTDRTPPYLHLARRMTTSEAAVDITQDIFLRPGRSSARSAGSPRFGTWLHRLAVNVILARRATLRTERSRVTDEEGILDVLPGRPGRSDLGMDFERAVEHLPDGAKTVFVLYDVEGYRHEEIATMLGSPRALPKRNFTGPG